MSKTIATALETAIAKAKKAPAPAPETVAMLEAPAPVAKAIVPPAAIAGHRPLMGATIDELADLIAKGEEEARFEVRLRFEKRVSADKPIPPKMRHLIESMGLTGGRNMGESKKAATKATASPVVASEANPAVVHHLGTPKPTKASAGVTAKQVMAALKGKDLAAVLAAIQSL